MTLLRGDQRSIRMTATDEQLREALAYANLPTLLLVLAQLTGDDKWLNAPFVPSRTKALNDNDDAGLSDELQQQVRDEAFEIIRAWRDSGDPVPAPPADEDLPGLLSFSLGEQVPVEYASSLAVEGGLHPREEVSWTSGRPAAADDFPVLIIGAGFSGLGTAAVMRQLGIPFQIIEKSDDIGGVWYQNSYPGAGVDTPSHLYGYSFAQRPTWTRYYAKQPEILDYINEAADAFDVRDHIRYNTEVEGAEWDEAAQRWHVRLRTADGAREVVTVPVVISAVGFLNRPVIPTFEGMDVFRGPMFHTAEWDHSVDVTGKRVAIIGTGATAMQVVPAIADRTDRVLVFQRSPQWTTPNVNYSRDVREEVQLLMEQLPYYAAFYRMRLIWMFQDKLLATLRRDPEWPHPERSVNAINERHRLFFEQYYESEMGDRTDLRDKVMPDYPPYGKRILMDNGWIRTMKRDDVELIAQGVRGFDETHVIASDGERHEVDVVVLSTGFESSRMLNPLDIRGRAELPLRELWGDDNPFAYLGITVPGFPNLFIISGPNTAMGHGGSNLFPSECSIAYTAQILVKMIEGGISSVDVREDVCEEYNRRVQEEHDRLIWTHPGMTTWYRNQHGRVTAPMPWRGVDFWEYTRTPNLDEFVVQARASQPVAAP